MDINLSYALSTEDLVGVLRTILLFLESINFKQTSTVLQNECSAKGYLEISAAPAKIVIVHSSISQSGGTNKGNQTDFPLEDEVEILEENVYSDRNDGRTHTTDYWKNNIDDEYSSHVIISHTIYQEQLPDETTTTDNECTVEKPIEGSKESQNNKKNKKPENQRSLNILESEGPTKTTTKRLSRSSGETSKQWYKRLRKTRSNPSLKVNSKTAKLDEKNGETEKSNNSRHFSSQLDNNCECQDLKKRFRQLQNEHRKLMGVTTELTTALQTHILGQSENLNSMLNNCRNIYPDLFKSVCNQNTNNFQNILTKHSVSEDNSNTAVFCDENPCNKPLHNETVPQNLTNSVYIEKENASEICGTCGTCNEIVENISPSTSTQNQFFRNSDNTKPYSSLKKDQYNDQNLLPICKNCDNVIHSDSDNRALETVSPVKENENSNNKYGDSPSLSTISNANFIRNSDNILLETAPPLKDNKKSNNRHHESPTSSIVSKASTIRNSDNILLGTESPLKENQKSKNRSHDSPTSGSLSRTPTIRNSDNIILGTLSAPKRNQNSNSKIRHDSPTPSSISNATTIRNSDRIEMSPVRRNVPYDKNSEDNHEDTVLVEVTTVVNNDTYSTTVLTPKLTRPHTSSVVLVSNKYPTTDSKILVRQMSSKSLDESLLNLDKESTSEFLAEQDGCEAGTEEGITEFHTTQIPEVKNVEQQTSNSKINQKTVQETPEIFITTDNLEKLQQGCNKCKTGESDYNSPRNKYFDLDFKKLKKDMLNGDVNLKLGIIQALRWRITESESETRDQVLSSYIRHDLLGLHSAPNTCGQSMTEIYYCPNKDTPHPLQEGMARLVNTFASLTLGRDYLCQDDDLVITLLVPLVIGTHYSKVQIDSVTRDMLMATLQKLSIRNRQRIRMISAGLVEFLVTFLATEHATINEYCMEYTTALLMNLCLHREARELLHSSATDVVSLLADLMNTKYRSCMPYVNGAMYSLLSDPCINKEAQRLNLAKLIEYHMKRTDGEMRRQLEFILKLHLQDGQNDCGCDPNLEPEIEVDLLEPELNSGDTIKIQPAGEEILKNYRLVFPMNGAQVNASHLKCLCRPVTPRAAQSNENFTIQVYQNEIIKETNFEIEDESPQVQEKQKSTCFTEKCTQSENSNLVDFTGRSRTPQCTCTAPISKQSNKSSPISTKRGCSPSEPITGFNKDTEKHIKQTCLSARTSRSNSPEMSYSEETKQFYHTPSAKTGIFEPQKQKKLHRVPPSFTRTIPLSQKPVSSTCDNPFCGHPYSKSMPVTPKENSSAANPPYALDYPVGLAMCYREGCIHQTENLNNIDGSKTCITCSNNNKRNRYRCNCYNVIKGYIDQAPENNTSDNRKNSTVQQATEKCFLLSTQNIGCNCHTSGKAFTRGSTTSQNCNDIPINHSNEVFVNFSYEELLKTIRTDRDHACLNPGADCQCYDVVFQSRPKILRTPP